MRCSVVIPCYNEGQNLPLLIQAFEQQTQRQDVEIIVVDNGSTDGSWTLLQELIAGKPLFRAHYLERNLGYGGGILAGLQVARGELLGWTHADMQTSPADVFFGLELFDQNGSDIFVKGLRKNRPFMDRFFTWGMGLFESWYLQVKLWDINAQPTLFSRAFYETWKSPPSDFSLDLYAFYWAQKQGLKIKRFPVMFPPRLHGQSSWNTGLRSKVRFIKRTLHYSSQLKRSLQHEANRSSNQ